MILNQIFKDNIYVLKLIRNIEHKMKVKFSSYIFVDYKGALLLQRLSNFISYEY